MFDVSANALFVSRDYELPTQRANRNGGTGKDNELLNRCYQALLTLRVKFLQKNILLVIDLLLRSIPKRLCNDLAIGIQGIQVDRDLFKDLLAYSERRPLAIGLN